MENSFQRGVESQHTSAIFAASRPIGLSHRLVTMAVMSELPADDTHDVIHRGGQVVAVVVPIAEYRQLRLALAEQRVNEEFDAARADYLARQKAGWCNMSRTKRRVVAWGCLAGDLPDQLGDPGSQPCRGIPQ